MFYHDIEDRLSDQYLSDFIDWTERLDPHTRTVVFGIRNSWVNLEGWPIPHKGVMFYMAFNRGLPELYLDYTSEAYSLDAFDEEDIILIANKAMTIWKSLKPAGVTHTQEITELANTEITSVGFGDRVDIDFSNGFGLYEGDGYIAPYDTQALSKLNVKRVYIEETVYTSGSIKSFLFRLVFESDAGNQEIYIGHTHTSLLKSTYGPFRVVPPHIDEDD